MNSTFGIIFKTINVIENKIYVGQTTKINSKNYFGSGDYLKAAIKKYGKENFKREIIDSASSLQDLNEKEIFWISKLNTQVPNGYNIEPGGGGTLKSEFTRKKMSDALKGKKLSEEHKKAIRDGWEKAIELREKFSKLYTGITLSKERKEAISKGQIGKLIKQETKDKIRNTMIGKNSGKQRTLQCIYCNKIGGVSAMSRHHFNNCKFKK